MLRSLRRPMLKFACPPSPPLARLKILADLSHIIKKAGRTKPQELSTGGSVTTRS